MEPEEETWRRILGTPIMDGDVVRFRHGKVEWFVYSTYVAPSGDRYLFMRNLSNNRIMVLGPEQHSRLRMIRHAK